MKAQAEFCESVRHLAILQATDSEGPDLVTPPAVAEICASHSRHRVAVSVPFADEIARSSEAPPHIGEAH
jgi:hypothetical protein